MTILAVDPGKQTGWACLKKEGIEWGREDFATGYLPERLCDWMTWLGNFIDFLGATTLIVEHPNQSRGYATASLYGMFGVALAVSWEKRITVVDFKATEIKKQVTGSGRATKEDLLAWARGRFGEVETHDEADALALLLTYQERMEEE